MIHCIFHRLSTRITIEIYWWVMSSSDTKKVWFLFIEVLSLIIGIDKMKCNWQCELGWMMSETVLKGILSVSITFWCLIIEFPLNSLFVFTGRSKEGMKRHHNSSHYSLFSRPRPNRERPRTNRIRCRSNEEESKVSRRFSISSLPFFSPIFTNHTCEKISK